MLRLWVLVLSELMVLFFQGAWSFWCWILKDGSLVLEFVSAEILNVEVVGMGSVEF